MAYDSTGRQIQLSADEAMKICAGMAPGATSGQAGTMTSSALYPGYPSTRQPAMGYPAAGFPPVLDLPGCQVNVNSCAFPSLETDLRLFSWPQIDQEMWDNFTQLNVLISGAFPLAAGGTLVLQQEARRNLTWIPDCVQISTTWTGAPQTGLLTYQWAVAPKNTVFPTGQVQFANTYQGNQFEPNQNQTYPVAFPDYKGVDTQVIGALSALQLIVSLSAAATSTLEAITITAMHKRGAGYKKTCGFNGVQPGQACGSCG